MAWQLETSTGGAGSGEADVLFLKANLVWTPSIVGWMGQSAVGSGSRNLQLVP